MCSFNKFLFWRFCTLGKAAGYRGKSVHLLKEELQNECKGSLFTFLGDPTMSISLPADQSIMCSSEMSQPVLEYGVGLGMLQQCSTLGCGAADFQESSHHYFSCSQKTWKLSATVLKSQLGLQGVLVIFKTPPRYVQLNFVRFWTPHAGSKGSFSSLSPAKISEAVIPSLQKSLFASSRALFSWLPFFTLLRLHSICSSNITWLQCANHQQYM